MPTKPLEFECADVSVIPVPIEGSNRKIVNADDVNTEEVLNWVMTSFEPEDVFSTTQLDKWAESEGYLKQSNTE